MYQNYNMYNKYYTSNSYRNVPANVINEEILTLKEALDSIKTSVGDEREDEIFYNHLIEIAPTESDKEVIRSIRDDEKKHNQILREVYYKLTGQRIPESTQQVDPNIEKLTYKEALEKALFGELNAVVRYRRIMGAMPDDESYTLLMSIMTDELRHANKYNYLINKAG